MFALCGFKPKRERGGAGERDRSPERRSLCAKTMLFAISAAAFFRTGRTPGTPKKQGAPCGYRSSGNDSEDMDRSLTGGGVREENVHERGLAHGKRVRISKGGHPQRHKTKSPSLLVVLCTPQTRRAQLTPRRRPSSHAVVKSGDDMRTAPTMNTAGDATHTTKASGILSLDRGTPSPCPRTQVQEGSASTTRPPPRPALGMR